MPHTCTHNHIPHTRRQTYTQLPTPHTDTYVTDIHRDTHTHNHIPHTYRYTQTHTQPHTFGFCFVSHITNNPDVNLLLVGTLKFLHKNYLVVLNSLLPRIMDRTLLVWERGVSKMNHCDNSLKSCIPFVLHTFGSAGPIHGFPSLDTFLFLYCFQATSSILQDNWVVISSYICTTIYWNRV